MQTKLRISLLSWSLLRGVFSCAQSNSQQPHSTWKIHSVRGGKNKKHRALSSSTYCCHFSLVFLSSEAYLDNQWILWSPERLPLARPSSSPAHSPHRTLPPAFFHPHPPICLGLRPGLLIILYIGLPLLTFFFFGLLVFRAAYLLFFSDWGILSINVLYLVKDDLEIIGSIKESPFVIFYVKMNVLLTINFCESLNSNIINRLWLTHCI